MGPIEMADQVELEICHGAGDMLRSELREMVTPAPAGLREVVAKCEVAPLTVGCW
jgi:hypothetical protein